MPYVERSEEIGRDFPVIVSIQREVLLSDDLTKILSRKVKGIDVRVSERDRSRRMSVTEAIVKRERGVYPATCEACGIDGLCILRQSGDRYVWTCVDGCPEEGD